MFHLLLPVLRSAELNGIYSYMALAHRGDALVSSKLKGHMDTHRQSSSSGQITCFVTQPDNVVLHIDVDSKAKGQEVLNKVPDGFAITFTLMEAYI